MSHQASHWALEQACETATEKAILMVLASYVGADGTCYPGQDTIARQACCSVKSVERALQAFEARGWLVRTARRRKDGSRSSDLITLILAPNPEANEQADMVSDRIEPTRHPVQTNPTPCPNQPDRVSGLTTFEPVRIEPVSESIRAREERAENDNTSDLFGASPRRSASGRSKAKPEPTTAEQADFDAFWSVYPRREAKKAALDAFLAVVRAGRTTAQDLFSGAVLYAASREGESPKFTSLPASWLNGRRWEDEIQEPPQGGYRNSGSGTWDPLQQAIDGIAFHSEDAA